VSTKVSEKHVATIFRVEELAKQENSMKQVASRALLRSCLAYSSTLKMEVTHSSESLVDFQWATWCFIPEDRTLHDHPSENLHRISNLFLEICILQKLVLKGQKLVLKDHSRTYYPDDHLLQKQVYY
jgi:hypothetical protein